MEEEEEAQSTSTLLRNFEYNSSVASHPHNPPPNTANTVCHCLLSYFLFYSRSDLFGLTNERTNKRAVLFAKSTTSSAASAARARAGSCRGSPRAPRASAPRSAAPSPRRSRGGTFPKLRIEKAGRVRNVCFARCAPLRGREGGPRPPAAGPRGPRRASRPLVRSETWQEH